MDNVDHQHHERQTPLCISGSLRESTTSRASISRGSSGVPTSRAMSAISSASSERLSATSARLSSRIHLPYKAPASSSRSGNQPQSPSSTYSTRILDCQSPISAYQVSSPHTPTQGDEITSARSNFNSLLPEVRDSSLQLDPRDAMVPHESLPPIYSQAVPKYERQKLTPGERRRCSNKIAPLGCQTLQKQQQQFTQRHKVTSIASTESAYSSGSGEADDARDLGVDEDLADQGQDHQHHQVQEGRQHQQEGRQLQQELRARIMASPYASAWPRASIPRRVHKLTWEEEQTSQYQF